MKKQVRNALIGAGFVATAALSSYVSTRILVRVALDRKEPAIMKKAGNAIAGATVDREFLNEVESAAERLKEKPHETVEITAQDGVSLVGHLFTFPGAERLVIAMHGWRSAWYRDFGTVADFWFTHKCNVLFVEQRGQNNSGGEYMGFGLTERFDCRDWAEWAAGRFGTSMPIYLCGVSMGATSVLMASGLALPENVRGIIADCGFTSPRAIFKHVANKNLHLSFGLRGAVVDAICRQKIKMGTDEYSTVDALRVNTRPVLLVHGTEDHFVPVEMTYENYRACAGEKRLLIVPGADHGMSYFTDKERYEREVLSFFRDFDAPKSEK